MRKKTIAILIILAGIAVLAYPRALAFYHQRQQAQIAAEWTAQLALLETEAKPGEGNGPIELDENVDGLLSIPAIDLEEPILRGITAANLNLSVAAMENMARVGEVGNYVVAGHRNHTFGRNFNRLAEIQTGDAIMVRTATDTFTYTVTEILYVDPGAVEF